MFPPIQTHFFIVNDLKYLIDDERELPSSSMFMHSFASSLFNNTYWYTDPVGNMHNILNSKLKSTSHEKTNREEEQMLIKIINAKYLHGTTNSVIPRYKFTISDFMKNLWRTQSLLRHTDEHDKEKLDKLYEPTISTSDGVINYSFEYDKRGGVDALITLINSYIIIKIIAVLAVLIIACIIYFGYESYFATNPQSVLQSRA